MSLRPIQAGRLRFRVAIEEAVEILNVYGEPDRTFQTFAVRWADIQPLRGRERFEAAQVRGEVTHRVILRAEGLEGVVPKMRVNVNGSGRIFEIEHVIDREERGRMLELLCREDV